MPARALLLRLCVLRALVVVLCTAMLLAGLASGAWAERQAAPMVDPGYL